MHAYLTTLGETLFPVLPTSVAGGILMPYDINAVKPSMATGFDLEHRYMVRLMENGIIS